MTGLVVVTAHVLADFRLVGFRNDLVFLSHSCACPLRKAVTTFFRARRFAKLFPGLAASARSEALTPFSFLGFAPFFGFLLPLPLPRFPPGFPGFLWPRALSPRRSTSTSGLAG